MGISGCVTYKGITDISAVDLGEGHQVLILKNEDAKKGVLPVLENWFQENGYSTDVITSLDEAKPENYVLRYSAKWNWDLAIYMRAVEMQLSSKGETLGNIEFDARQYGGHGKFGSAEKRLNILLDALFGKITVDEANKLLGES